MSTVSTPRPYRAVRAPFPSLSDSNERRASMASMANGRFAPSPTGELHLGNLRTALVAWLLARSAGSRFVLRMEDLDPVTSNTAHQIGQERDLAALGIDWDGEVVRQSARTHLYDEAIGRLTAEGRTYRCYCTRREIAEAAQAPHEQLAEGAYTGTCRDLSHSARVVLEASGRRPALRLRADGVEVAFTDRWRGEVTGVVDDVVLRRNDDMPAYNLAVVVDDAEQGIEEVVRGDDLVPSTPRQVLISRLLGLPDMSYAHVSMAVGPSGKRLAKRDGAVTMTDLAVVGRPAPWVRSLLGHSLGLATIAEDVDTATLLRRFDPDALPKEPWVWTASN